ncbi:porin [Pantoea sp. 1.19]|uniref:porin n=1 Tax=Pantoea sp. 1.19 TaxID=1925589 RepID=UPI0009489864|nr:porin [Pantoea sp. 1.19]
MQQRVLAILIPLAFSTAAPAAEIYNKNGNKLDLYGRVKAMHYLSDDPKLDGDTSYIRLGFKGQTQINEVLTGYGQWEYQVAANVAESQGSTGSKTRLGFAGLKAGDLGSFDYGRNYGIIYDVEAFTDMLPEFGATGYTKTDTYMLTRANGVATWRNNNFFGLVDGLKVAVQYQGKNENAARPGGVSNGDGAGVSLAYEVVDGLSVVGAYSSANRTLAQKQAVYGKGNKADAWATGVKYDNDGLYLAATWAETRNMNPIAGTANVNGISTPVSGVANQVTNLELVAQYQFEGGLRPSLAWVKTRAKDIENGVGDAVLAKFIDIAATWYFNKNMSAFVDYKLNQLRDDNRLALANDDVVAVGLVYQF